MNKISRFIILLVTTGISYSVYGTNRDTLINDTLLLAQDKIIEVTVHCNGPDELMRINSQAEFDKFFGNDCKVSPTVDFSKETLLYFPTKASGCKTPDYIKTVKIANGMVVYHILIVQHGGCDMLISHADCIVIPKTYSDYAIDYKYDVVTK